VGEITINSVEAGREASASDTPVPIRWVNMEEGESSPTQQEDSGEELEDGVVNRVKGCGQIEKDEGAKVYHCHSQSF